MKLITAIVRPEKVNDVLAALFEADVRGLTVSPARGHGGETEEVETYRGTKVMMGLVEKVRIEIGVSDHLRAAPWTPSSSPRAQAASATARSSSRT